MAILQIFVNCKVHSVVGGERPDLIVACVVKVSNGRPLLSVSGMNRSPNKDFEWVDMHLNVGDEVKFIYLDDEDESAQRCVSESSRINDGGISDFSNYKFKDEPASRQSSCMRIKFDGMELVSSFESSGLTNQVSLQYVKGRGCIFQFGLTRDMGDLKSHAEELWVEKPVTSPSEITVSIV